LAAHILLLNQIQLIGGEKIVCQVYILVTIPAISFTENNDDTRSEAVTPTGLPITLMNGYAPGIFVLI
jgi:hypothetical protein